METSLHRPSGRVIVVGLPVLLFALAPAAPAEPAPTVSERLAIQDAQTGSIESKDPEWWSDVRKALEASEYRITWQEQATPQDPPAGYQAPNRANGFRAYFTPGGMHLVPRVKGDPGWEWSLRLESVGRGGDFRPVAAAELAVDGNRIEYRRDGLVEWYVNGTDGLEQGFTLQARASTLRDADDDAEPLTLTLSIHGDLTPRFDAERRSINFLGAAAVSVLHYSQLRVIDATGNEIPSRFESGTVEGKPAVRIVIDDVAAVYPITVDPLATSPAWTSAGNQVLAGLGWSVATAGDVNGDGFGDVIVGAQRYDNGQTDEGRVFVFHGGASGPVAVATWTAEANQAVALFGSTVAPAGDVNGDGYSDVLVGARLYDAGQTDEGAAFMFLGSATGLDQGGTRPSGTPANANWTAEGNQPASWFGMSLSAAGDVNGDGYSDVLVGAPNYDDGETDEGAAFLYLGSATGLGASPAWSAKGGQTSADFGVSVSLAGDVNGDGFSDVILGADGYSDSETSEGHVSVYHGSASGLATAPSWIARGEQAVSGFGALVATVGDVNGDGYADIAVGSYLYDAEQTDEGAVFVFHGSATGLDNGSRPVGSPSNADWSAQSGQPTAEFGAVVASAGDVNGDGYADLVVGSPAFSNGEASEGSAFAYFGSAGGLGWGGTRSPGTPANADWRVESHQASSNYGGAVATAGDVNGDGYSDIIVGASRYDDPETDEGRAHLYLGSASGPSATAGWTTDGVQSSMNLGHSVAGAGDVNGDGYSDVIVGAHAYDNGQPDEGLAQLYLGSSSGLATTPAWSAEGDQSSSDFGLSVAAAGDVNGDGYGDVIVGAPSYDNGESNEGRAYVYLGSPSAMASTPAWTAESNQSDASFGISVASAGDVDGDGYADVIVGAQSYDAGEPNEGRAYVFHGTAGGLSATPQWIAESNQYYANFGLAVSSAGDVNGDGFSDVVVGAPDYDYYVGDGGRAYVYLGSAAGLTASSSWTYDGIWSSEYLGGSVSASGDVNGDGYSDVIVGAMRASYTASQGGRALVFSGSATGLASSPAWQVGGDQNYSRFGISVASAGDVNGDGYSDVVVGADLHSESCTYEGKALLYLGSASGPSTSPQWTARNGQCYAQLGRSVASAGDVNGDGYSDVVIGSPYYDDSYGDAGRVYVFYGNGGLGASLAPQQRRADDSAPISPLGWSDSQTGFRLAMQGRTPFGRGRVRMEWEVKQLGLSFDGTGLGGSAAWVDNGPIGFNELVSGLTQNRAYHWRARLVYDPAATPFQQRGRWVAGTWNGVQEEDVALPRSTALSLSMTDNPDPYVINFHTSGITYNLVIGNSGPEQANVSVQDTLPVGATFVSATPSQGSCGLSGNIVTCGLGVIEVGGSATIAIVVTPLSPGTYTNAAVLVTAMVDPDQSDNSAQQQSTALMASIGDRVWSDLDGDGVQDPGEPGIVSAIVYLFDGGTGAFLDVTFANASGVYTFTNVHGGPLYRLRFIPPVGYVIAPRDVGMNDNNDSDADLTTGDTVAFSLSGAGDRTQWDAGMVPSVPCVAPDETIYIYSVGVTTDGNAYPILNFMDPNQPDQITGYNVYRSSDAALPQASWTLVASDVVDMDEASPNKQWIDTTGAVAPTGIWYYNVTAYNHKCPAEGPW